MKKYVMEFIGTFFLVLTIGMSVIAGGSGVIPPLAIGSVLMVMIFAGGHISGGHYNPAVTLGVWMRGRTETKDVVPYMIFQTAGALIAATVVKYLDPTAVVHPRVLAVFPALLAEFLFTFALVFVVINTATAKGTSGNSFYGLAIGFTVPAGAFAMGSVTVGAFNPAVAVGVSVMGKASSISASRREHRPGISRILLDPLLAAAFNFVAVTLEPDRLPDFQVDLSASNSGGADGDRWLVLADLSVTTARKLSVPLQSGCRPPRGRIGDAVAPRDGRGRSTMEGAGQHCEGTLMKAAVYTRYGPPDVVQITDAQ